MSTIADRISSLRSLQLSGTVERNGHIYKSDLRPPYWFSYELYETPLVSWNDDIGIELIKVPTHYMTRTTKTHMNHVLRHGYVFQESYDWYLDNKETRLPGDIWFQVTPVRRPLCRTLLDSWNQILDSMNPPPSLLLS